MSPSLMVCRDVEHFLCHMAACVAVPHIRPFLMKAHLCSNLRLCLRWHVDIFQILLLVVILGRLSLVSYQSVMKTLLVNYMPLKSSVIFVNDNGNGQEEQKARMKRKWKK